MKKVIPLFTFFGLLLTIGLAQQSTPQMNWARISETLETQMKNTPDDEYIEVTIIMYDQVDLLSMMDYFRTEKVSLNRRTKQVINSLQAKAAATQPALISYMKGLDGVQAGSIKPFWISNEIQAKLNRKGIEALSLRAEIDFLVYEPPHVFLDDKTEAVEEMLYSPNGHEPGHDLMNVPAMWAKGYTGGGRKVFVIDEGADLNHPGLNRNYRGFVDKNRVSFFDSQGGLGDTIPAKCADFNDHGTWVIGCAVGYDFGRRDTIGVAPNGLWMSSPLLTGDNDPNSPTYDPGNCQQAANSSTPALQWAIDPDGDPNTIEDMPDVVNMSFGFGALCSDDFNFTTAFQNRINALEAAGVAVIVAAGNAGPGASTTGVPASSAISLVNSFAVGAVTQGSGIAGFSSRGPTTCTDSMGSLEIKPEVVAPGQNIRTTSNGNTFANIQGTSFASPYACGMFLLLKEAFPTLSGEDIKLAMYFGAKDLGAAGEDNDFGMGILDAVGAFDYLVAQGNTPEPRNPDSDGLIHNLNDLGEFSCSQSIEPSFVLENSGTSTMTSATINYAYSNGVTGTVNWTGTLLKNRSERVDLPAESFPIGEYSLSIELTQVNGKTEFTVRDNKIVEEFGIFEEVVPMITTTSPLACNGGSAILEATIANSDREVVWYDAATGGEIVGIGSPFITPELTANTTFYAEAMKVVKAGLPDINAGQSFASLSDDSYLTFNVLNDLELRSIKVYASTTGIRRIAINDVDGNLVGRTSFLNLQVGENIIEMNVPIPRGNGYRMLQVGQVDDLFATVNNFSFPLVVDEVIQITGSNDGLYNFFYDWEIVSSFNCSRVEQEVSVSSNQATASFNPSRTTLNLANSGRVNFNNTSTNSTSYSWDFGDGAMSTDQNPSHDYLLEGTYTVTLIATGPGGCTDVATTEIVATGIVGIDDELAELGNISVYPNPSEGKFILDIDLFNREEIEIEVFDLPGRRIWNSSSKAYLKDRVEIDLNAANNGIYLLKVRVAGLTWIQKLIKE